MMGTTIYDLDLLLHAICPGNVSTSPTITVYYLYHEAPQTPFPLRIRRQATGP